MGRHNQNIDRLPSSEPNINDNIREVQIGYRKLHSGGAVGKIVSSWFGSFFGPEVVGRTYNPPNPTYHWSVVVGDHIHHLQAKDGWNFYENENLEAEKGELALFRVGETSFNDIAIKNAGIYAINAMPEKYNAYDNNCQAFVITLLDVICRSGRLKVHTSYSLRKLQIAYLDQEDQLEEGKEVEAAVPGDGEKHMELLTNAQDIMNQWTPELTQEEATELRGTQ